jgi:hypothetical protein
VKLIIKKDHNIYENHTLEEFFKKKKKKKKKKVALDLEGIIADYKKRQKIYGPVEDLEVDDIKKLFKSYGVKSKVDVRAVLLTLAEEGFD